MDEDRQRTSVNVYKRVQNAININTNALTLKGRVAKKMKKLLMTTLRDWQLTGRIKYKIDRTQKEEELNKRFTIFMSFTYR